MLDLGPICTAFNTSKSLASPTGRWSLTLTPSLVPKSRRLIDTGDVVRALRPMSAVAIGWHRSGGIMFGFVDSVQRSRSLGGGRVSDSITVSGTDFGKAFVHDELVGALLTTADSAVFRREVAKVAPESSLLRSMLEEPWGPEREDGSKSLFNARIADVVPWLLTNVPAMRVPLLEGMAGNPQGRIGDVVRYNIPKSWNDGRLQILDNGPLHGTVWSFLMGLLDPDFYEVFIDTGGPELVQESIVFTRSQEVRDGQLVDVLTNTLTPARLRQVSGVIPGVVPPVIVFVRPKPFDEPALNWLPTKYVPELTWDGLRTRFGLEHHVIDADMVVSEQMGFSDAEVYSYYLVNSTFDLMNSPATASLGLFYPALDLYALAHHGVRVKESRISLLSSDLEKVRGNDEAETNVMVSDTLEFRNRLYNWNRLNDYFESGSLTVVGHDDYKVGDPVLLPWREAYRGEYVNKSAQKTDVPPEGMRYYCVAVSHRWSYGQPFMTTLSLQRGHNAALIDYAKKHIEEAGEKYTNAQMTVTG